MDIKISQNPNGQNSDRPPITDDWSRALELTEEAVRRGDRVQALEHAELAVRLVDKVAVRLDLRRAEALAMLAHVFESHGKFALAAEALRKANIVAEEMLGPRNEEFIAGMWSLANLEYQDGNHKEAIELLERVMGHYRDLQMQEPLAFVKSAFVLTQTYYADNQDGKAGQAVGEVYSLLPKLGAKVRAALWPLFEAAADDAHRMSRPAESLALLQTALELLGEAGESTGVSVDRLHFRMVTALSWLGRQNEAIKLLDPKLKAITDPTRKLPLAIRIATLWDEAGQPVFGERLIRDVLQEFDASSPDAKEERVSFVLALAQACDDGNKFVECRKLLATIAPLMRKASDDDQISYLMLSAAATSRPEMLPHAEKQWRAALVKLESRKQAKVMSLIGSCCMELASNLLDQDSDARLDEVEQLLQRAMNIFYPTVRTKLNFKYPRCLALLGALEEKKGDLHQAEEHFLKAEGEYERACGGHRTKAFAGVVLPHCLYLNNLGRYEESSTRASAALNLVGNSTSPLTQYYLELQADNLEHLGDVSEADRLSVAATAMQEELDRLNDGELYREQDDDEEGAE